MKRSDYNPSGKWMNCHAEYAWSSESEPDDDYYYSGSEGDEPVTKDSLGTKSKGKGAGSAGSSQGTCKLDKGHGGSYGDEYGDDYSTSSSSYRHSYNDSDDYPSSSHHSYRSKHPSSSSSSANSHSTSAYASSSYDSQGYPIARRTRNSGDNLSAGGHYHQSSDHQSHHHSSSPHKASKRKESGAKQSFRAPLPPTGGGEEYENYLKSLHAYENDESELPEYSSRHRSRTRRPESHGSRDRDERSPPPGYTTQPGSGGTGTSGGRRRRSERKKLGKVEEDEEWD